MIKLNSRSIINTVIIAISALLISSIIHILLEMIFPFENSLTGKPNMIYFIPIMAIQVVLLVIAYNLIKEYLSFNQN